ncbi:Thiol-disulfide isomerase or thioredoxin [Salegentibacter holothuriorum]|uniref:Thiol-disulfide isomerase or thioredoxin n=1 Tax=Salegentibacter holothuriorum TaxID=241145 RepID=A0A1T5E798_9FLAO|nr:thioredoxin family protein [Salegentibacter holothuriorum]SKB79837.1 Thiol-disulfide isomerase or thioredoxin [Salegentibacter holothuriorum]
MINKILLLFLGVFITTGEVSDKTEKLANIDSAEMLLGEFTQADLEKSPYSRWFTPGYANYKPNAEAVETIKKNIGDYEILLFMGTWCGDSRYEVPKFFKLLDLVDFNRENLTSIAVNYSKKAPGDLDEKYNIHRVPTIIFIKDGKEVNRFVEYSVENLEEDIARIVDGKEYIDPYSE